MAQEWEQRGIRAVAFLESDSGMIPACERLYGAVVHKRLVRPDDPDLNAHVHAAVAEHDAEAGDSRRRTAPPRRTPSSRLEWRSTGRRFA